ncbi:hypothetical protein [uncultured Clostridium sp.]|uniref:hypothetical protein n=1 Tax=uncultured Clostridium sp. TaxID=59620 RepID=UPI00260A52DA|nr:hypothetical protein [uncultured Clostridium sp.]
MRDNIFRKTEKKLYDYFDKDNLIKSCEDKIKYLNKCYKDLEDKIKNVDIKIDADIKAISYEERVQTSNDGISCVEKMMVKMIEDLEIEKARVYIGIDNLERRIRNINEKNKIIESNINMFNEDILNFIKYKYADKKPNKEIAMAMNMSKSGITRIKELTIKRVNSWEETLFPLVDF